MSDVYCKHCGVRITLHNFTMGPGWRHVDSSFNGYWACKIGPVATPPDEVRDA